MVEGRQPPGDQPLRGAERITPLRRSVRYPRPIDRRGRYQRRGAAGAALATRKASMRNGWKHCPKRCVTPPSASRRTALGAIEVAVQTWTVSTAGSHRFAPRIAPPDT